MHCLGPLKILAVVAALAVPGASQSLGFYPTLNLGFNPYLSPLYGYGLGLGYGAGLAPVKAALQLGGGGPLISKLHGKTLLKQLTLPGKLVALRDPELAFSPYNFDYTFGRHYGAAMLPNNPYKSAYMDYYATQPDLVTSASAPIVKHHRHNFAQASPAYPPGPHIESSADALLSSKKHALIKPLLKVGALLTATALLAKKTYDLPTAMLNPAGMIIGNSQVAHQFQHNLLQNRL